MNIRILLQTLIIVNILHKLLFLSLIHLLLTIQLQIMIATEFHMVQLLLMVGGTEPFNYVFTNTEGKLIADSNVINGLSAGTYLMIINDSNDCELQQEININQADEILLSHAVSNESCLGANDGSIVTTVSNFQGSYQVIVQNPDNDMYISLSSLENYNLAPGSYIMLVNDSELCYVQDTITIEEATDIEFAFKLHLQIMSIQMMEL